MKNKKLQSTLLAAVLSLTAISGQAVTALANEVTSNDALSTEATTTALKYKQFGTYRGEFFVQNGTVFVFAYETVNAFGQTVYVYSYN